MRVFNKVIHKLTKCGPMESIRSNALAASVNSLFAALRARPVDMKMMQVLPTIDTIVGMALNTPPICTIDVTADNLYRECLLLEHYGQDEADVEVKAMSDGTDNPDNLDEEFARYAESAEVEGRLQALSGARLAVRALVLPVVPIILVLRVD